MQSCRDAEPGAVLSTLGGPSSPWTSANESLEQRVPPSRLPLLPSTRVQMLHLLEKLGTSRRASFLTLRVIPHFIFVIALLKGESASNCTWAF